jgi:hypothetical protein
MKKISFVVVFCLLAGWSTLNAQGRNADRVNYLVGIIDSLDQVILEKNAKLHRSDSLLELEKSNSATLREELNKKENIRKTLESDVTEYQGENLKLNQSNRILIVFNSFVAVLLIVTLVFYLRKMNRKPDQDLQIAGKIISNSSTSVHASFEDKLQQLERLGKLREKGFLSDEEFITEKNQILGK